jgi:RecB family exonuclease
VSFIEDLKKAMRKPPKHRKLPRKRRIVLHGNRESDLWGFASHGLSVSAIELFLLCPEQFRLKYAEGLRSFRTSAALDFGNLWHWMLSRAHDTRYKKQMNLDRTLTEVDGEWRLDHPQAYEKQIQEWQMSLAKTRALWPVYAKKFAGDWKRKWLGVEKNFSVKYEITNKRTTKLHGIWDGVFEDSKQLWLQETKTKSQIDEFEIEDTLHLDNQVMMYLWTMQEVYGRQPAGVEYNVIRNPGMRLKAQETLPEFERRLKEEIRRDDDHYFKRWRLTVTKEQLWEWRLTQLHQILLRIENWATMDGPHYVNTKALIGKYGRCEMFNVITKRDFTEVTQRQPRKMERDR